MKCPICELFGRELHFQTRKLLDQHSSRFHGLSAAQLDGSEHAEPVDASHPPDKAEPMRARRFLH